MKYTESDTNELKRELTDAVKEVMISFLNTKGGILYVGVNDDGSLNSTFLSSDRDDIDLKLGNWIQDNIYPVPFKCVDYSFNADGVLVINVKEGTKKPYYLKSKGPKPSGCLRELEVARETPVKMRY